MQDSNCLVLLTPAKRKREEQVNDWVKYPRTYHLPCSPGATNDDRFMDTSVLEKCIVIASEKLDGENTTIYRDGFHARSLNYKYNKTRDIISRWHAMIAPRIPEGVRICGENISYKHSISYKDMDHFFYVHSVWSGNRCLSVMETIEYCHVMGLRTVYDDVSFSQGEYKTTLDHTLHMVEECPRECEGFVIRAIRDFRMDEFHDLVGKWVRPNHVQTDEHWGKNAELNGFDMNVMEGNI